MKSLLIINAANHCSAKVAVHNHPRFPGWPLSAQTKGYHNRLSNSRANTALFACLNGRPKGRTWLTPSYPLAKVVAGLGRQSPRRHYEAVMSGDILVTGGVTGGYRPTCRWRAAYGEHLRSVPRVVEPVSMAFCCVVASATCLPFHLLFRSLMERFSESLSAVFL